MCIESSAQNLGKPQRGGMIGHAEFFRDASQAVPQIIAPRWDLKELVRIFFTEETLGWATDARSRFPLPFGRGEGQGEGIHANMPTGRSFPLTPAFSPSAGERENRTTATVFCSPSRRLLSNARIVQEILTANSVA